MIIPIPAIDLKGGKVVRLLQGRFEAETVYGDKPEAIARRFVEDGASRLHVVDLDGALSGKPENWDAVERILKTVTVPVEMGGGIRSPETIERCLAMGVRWAVLGTRACLDAGFLKEVLREFGDRVIVGIDARDGVVATDAWTKTSNVKAVDLARRAESDGAQTLIYTDISKDGALAGPNLAEIRRVAESVKAGVIASGGISSVRDLKALAQLKLPNLSGAVIGKALYEKKLTVKEALEACSPSA